MGLCHSIKLSYSTQWPERTEGLVFRSSISGIDIIISALDYPLAPYSTGKTAIPVYQHIFSHFYATHIVGRFENTLAEVSRGKHPFFIIPFDRCACAINSQIP